MANAWFETVAVAQGRARKRLPKSVYGALVAGSEKGVTVRDNVAAFSELGFAPHVAGLSTQRDLSTTVMGQPVSLPVFISPIWLSGPWRSRAPPTTAPPAKMPAVHQNAVS